MQNLESLASAAAAGNQSALEQLLRVIKDDVYGLAMRMLADPTDAEDATQEILVKVATHVSTFRGASAFRTWVWRIATNHLLSVRRSRREPDGLTFEGFEQMLAAGVAARAEPPPAADTAVLEEEVKLGCTHAMLMCLDREHRLAFLLGAVLEMPGDEAAEILEIEPAAFRKRLSRARERLRDFMTRNCGLVSQDAACRCRSQIGPSINMGMLHPDRLVYTIHPRRARTDPTLWKTFRTIEAVEDTVSIFRNHPDYAGPDTAIERFRQMLQEL